MIARETTYPSRAGLACRSFNAWPEGRRRLRCLGCGRLFWSRSKAERQCVRCRGESNKGRKEDREEVQG